MTRTKIEEHMNEYANGRKYGLLPTKFDAAFVGAVEDPATCKLTAGYSFLRCLRICGDDFLTDGPGDISTLVEKVDISFVYTPTDRKADDKYRRDWFEQVKRETEEIRDDK